jgi:hypothetical protein
VIAHVGGIPIEELLLPSLAGGGSLLLARCWLSTKLRRHRGSEE